MLNADASDRDGALPHALDSHNLLRRAEAELVATAK
jgi:hypothetical protein